MLLTSLTLSARTKQDVIHLKNGEVVKGEIVAQEFNTSVQIRTADGNVLTFQMDEVEMISSEGDSVDDRVTTRGKWVAMSQQSEITIPESVTKIHSLAFFYSTELKSLTCLNPAPPKCYIGTFDNVPKSTCILYVPKGSKDAYSKAKEWKSFKHIVEME